VKAVDNAKFWSFYSRRIWNKINVMKKGTIEETLINPEFYLFGGDRA